MSKLLKSKFFLGVATLVVAFAVVATVSAADGAITKTLKKGMKDVQVKYLQQTLNEKGFTVASTGSGSAGHETTYFGPATVSAVKAFQKAMALSTDGVFGPKSRAALEGAASTGGSTGESTLPAGCKAGDKFSATTGQSCAGGSVPVATGPVTAMLSTDTPASGYIISNQATADMLHVAFNGTGVVTSISLHRSGISNQNVLTNVYLFDGNTRVTDGYSFNNSGDLVMNGLNIAVNGPKVISVKADVESSATTDGSTIAISLTSYTAGATPTAANLMGNTMNIGTGTAATAYLNTTNTVSSPTVNAGTSSYAVWSAPVQVNTRAVWLKGVSFRVTGSAPSDALQNLHLFVDGVDTGKISVLGAITGSNYQMFDLSSAPVSLSTGSHTVELRADVVKGSSYNVVVSIQQAADLVLFDSQVGVNIAVTKDGTNAYSANSSGTISIAAGSASVVVDPTFQSATNVTGGATNVVIGKFKVHGYGEDVKVSSLDVTPALASTTPTAAGLNNLAVYFNGSQVGSSFNWTSGTHTFQLGSQMILPAGTDSYIEVRADLQTTGSVNYTAGTVTATLAAGTTNGQGQTSHSTIGFPGASVSTSGLTIQTGVLAVSKNAGYASQNVNPNTANVKIGSYVLQNQSTSESVRVTTLSVGLTRSDGSTALTSTASSGSYPALTNFSNLKTSETSGSGSTPIQPAASNTFSVNFTLAPGATKTLDVFADTSADSSSSAFATTLTVTSLGSSSNVSISQNGNGTAVAGQVLTLAIGTVTNPPTLLSSSSTAAQYVPAAQGGASNVAKATFNIAATSGAATVTEAKFTVNSQDVSTAASAGTLTSATTGVAITITANAGFAVGDYVKITGSGTTAYGIVESNSGTTLTVTITEAGSGTPSLVAVIPNTATKVTVGSVSAPVVSGVAYLTGLNLTVPNGSGGLNQDVYVSYAEVGTNGTRSGATSRIALEYLKYTTGGTTKTLCTAAISASCTATLAVGGVAAPTMTLVGSSPTLTAAKPTATVAVGNIEAVDVTVSANAKGNIQINTLKINVTPNAATMGTSANTAIVKDSNNQTVSTTNTAFATSAGGATTITFGSGYTISAGTSQTFKIFVPVAGVTGTGVNGASLSTSLPAGAASFTWTDLAGNASAAQAGSSVATGSLPTALIPAYPSTFTATIYN